MTAKEFLSRGYRINDLIDSEVRELSRLRERMTSLSSPGFGEKVSSGNAGDASYTRTVEKIIALESKIDSEIDELVSVQAEIREVIGKVQDRDERLLLRLRYVEYLKWAQISARMNFSIKQCRRIHSKALINIGTYLKDVPKCP